MRAQVRSSMGRSWRDASSISLHRSRPGAPRAGRRLVWRADRARGREGSTPWWIVGLAGALLSLVIELGQLFIAERVTSLLDVATNGLGAAIGARAFNLVRPRVHLGASRRPALLGGVALWFLVSALPGASFHPEVLVSGTVLAVGAAWLRSRAVARLRLLSRPASGGKPFA
jgi:hypothetical protein